ncbi:methyl-accepting chemotaxis protein [Rhizobium sp. 9140]|uniref:methyl-accepting chemotaxis protein n=1 Tax=Rhizobium sp. 9140 TaxID=1761900 RepID=UPI00079ACECA|nr:HAMP domain-containing methyl-accepting chemotaxis protein [Rhizobium sp. 9140]CZT36732.1 methyl-accepting chemotaxis protein [Rhizobium sp. 9140]
MIDRLMSRIRIQTKVLVLVTPFVLSITAVGITGLYTSGLLQGRMEISNSVLQSLSGFKEVFSAMSRFLMQPSPETHDAARRELSDEIANLKTMADGLRAETDVARLDEALAQSASIAANIETLWALQTDRERIATAVGASTEELLAVQAAAGKQAFVLLASAKTLEKSAKSDLKTALQVGALGSAAQTLATQATAAASDADRIKVIKTGLPAVSTALDATIKALGKTSLPAVDALKPQMAAVGDGATKAGTDPFAVGNLVTALASLDRAAAAIKTASDDALRNAVSALAAAEGEIAKADRVGNKLRAIVGNANQIRVVFAELAAVPDEGGVKTVQQALYAYGKEMEGLATAVPGDTVLAALPAKAKPAMASLEANALALVALSAKQRSEFDAAAAQIDGTWTLLTEFAESQKQSAGTEREQANTISLGATLAGILIALLAGTALVITLKGPIGQITAAMRRLADGALDTSITGENRSDEIGDMARALSVFKGNALTKVSMEEQAEATRRETETQRRRNDTDRQEAAQQVQFAVDTLAQGLSRLARGDMSVTIETPFAAHLDRLRSDFNASVGGLRETLSEIRNISSAIHHNGQQMADAVGDLAKRTEQQAAALEETSAAVDEVSSTVRTAAGRANDVQGIVQRAKRNADNSSGIVQNAISAMMRIREASDKIGQIVGAIDTIAFQTNLLALNAGVEAARAGEAGKGFAVVAQEVRDLAQRSAQAAKEIGGLIAKSSAEVATGSQYVEQTGSALMEIAHQIVDIAGHVDHLAISSRDQSTSLESVNGSVNQIDHMTQQNAAMVEETNAATLQLAEDIDMLAGLVSRFRLLEEDNVRHARAA